MGKGTRASTACARCYKRKKKCSRDFPTCSECAQAGVNCIGLDRGTESELPRSIVSFLEDAVAKLELERHRYGPPSISDRQSELFDPGSVEAPRTIASSSDGHDLQALYSLSMFSASTSFPYKAFNPNPRDVHPYYRTFFMGAELPYPLAFTVKRPVHAPRCNNSTELTKLPPGVTEALFSTYTDRILPQYPVYTLEEVASLQSKYVSAATDCTLLTPIEQFTASMILAISVLSTRSKDYRKLASLAESLRRDAYARVGYGANIAQPTITSVQQLLLVAQYGFLLPSSTNLWQVVGDAMKTALGLGLHQEAPHHYGLDQETIQFRRRLFWVLYVLERSVAITSHRPYAVAGDMIGTALPEMSNESIPKEPGHYSCYFISFKDRVRVIRIQSELCSINIGKRVILTPSSAYDRWMQEMERRIHELTQTEHTKGFRIMAWQCLILLHMPCAHNPSPSPESTIKCFNAAVELSSGYWELVQSDFVDYPWHGVHKCYEAGMLILYHLWYSASVIRQHYSTRQIFEAVNNLSGFFVCMNFSSE
ncbi:hypothetical protein BU24DRAFT_114447 [Aaosphaeria arxii CBS 175.79]|uniref:Zn(2)-C6 fungal-type domain-containing protein n=1 Tax=Aaosphaeria arxii CBS 175.79 TaxID=1450172 RepID=A0A6A5Y115_9PLEO|nr:uncharacterized protein BU24DRAFT_114447 [Aaosphaeria arxii CBS 175.79]KAF2019162.1 hypothetical protein BU24DRAFT_114447 [Aaosphaeria arxii CBS 175.79]